MYLFNFGDDNVVSALIWTMLHSFWQFTLIALVMSILLKMYQDHKSPIRYFISLASMVLALVVFIGTFAYYIPDESALTSIFLGAEIFEHQGFNSTTDWWQEMQLWIAAYQRPIFITYIMGVILFGVRFLGAMIYVEYLVKTRLPIQSQATFDIFDRMTAQFGIKDRIRIGESLRIHSPMILGFWKPVILFPVGMINHLNLQETEAILAHELAHFVRKDVYINIVQTLIEALLYYHPAIWWISANIRVERENCCDEQAIQYLGDHIHYAKTLVKMQEIQVNGPTLALHFNHKNSFFSNRIKRILNMSQTRNFLKEKIITLAVLILFVLLSTKDMTGTQMTMGREEVGQNLNNNAQVPVTIDSVPVRKESIRIQKRSNDKDVKIAIEDGKVTELEVDGKKIDEADYDKYEDIIAQSTPRSGKNGSSRMYFFGDGTPQNFEFDYGGDDQIFSDSLFKNFNFKGFEGLQSFDLGRFNEQMKQLQERLGQMQFDFHGLDSLDRNLDGLRGFHFSMPNLDDLSGGNFELYDQDERDHEAPDWNGYDGAYNGAFPEKNKNFSDVIGNTLNRDGLLIPNQKNKVELTGKFLKINGEKQPNNIYQKYKRIFEEVSGTTLEKNSKLQFSFEGKESKRKYRVY